MIGTHSDEGIPRARPSLFWSVVEPLFSLMDIRSRAVEQEGNARIRLPHPGSRTSWAVRGVERAPITDGFKEGADESCW
jgi:hypothetical protein